MVKDGLLKYSELTAACSPAYRRIYHTPSTDKYKPKEWDHDYGLTDVLLSIWFRHKETNLVEIYRSLKFKGIKDGKGFNYRPDALIRITDQNMKTKNYVLEFERSRHKGEELSKINKTKYLTDLIPYKMNTSPEEKLLGQLSKNTVFLFVVAHNASDVYDLNFDRRDEKFASALNEHKLPPNILVVPYRSLYIT
jgi:hypothetical protein